MTSSLTTSMASTMAVEATCVTPSAWGVEGDDIDDPHDLDVVRDELRCGADILQAATVAPHVNQLLVHAGNTPTDLR